jgi:hypothetical protein
MRNDRPKVIGATIIFFLVGIAAVTLAAISFGSLQGAAPQWLALGLFGLIGGIVLIVILMNDPYPHRGAVTTKPRQRAMAYVLEFSVGDRETHQVLYRWDQIWGWLTVSIDGVVVVKQLITFSFRLVRVVEFTVGQEETHRVRVEKRRPVTVSYARPQPLTAFVDGTPVATQVEAPSV